MSEIAKKTNLMGIFFTLAMFIIIAGYFVEVIRGSRSIGVIFFTNITP